MNCGYRLIVAGRRKLDGSSFTKDPNLDASRMSVRSTCEAAVCLVDCCICVDLVSNSCDKAPC